MIRYSQSVHFDAVLGGGGGAISPMVPVVVRLIHWFRSVFCSFFIHLHFFSSYVSELWTWLGGISEEGIAFCNLFLRIFFSLRTDKTFLELFFQQILLLFQVIATRVIISFFFRRKKPATAAIQNSPIWMRNCMCTPKSPRTPWRCSIDLRISWRRWRNSSIRINRWVAFYLTSKMAISFALCCCVNFLQIVPSIDWLKQFALLANRLFYRLIVECLTQFFMSFLFQGHHHQGFGGDGAGLPPGARFQGPRGQFPPPRGFAPRAPMGASAPRGYAPRASATGGYESSNYYSGQPSTTSTPVRFDPRLFCQSQINV